MIKPSNLNLDKKTSLRKQRNNFISLKYVWMNVETKKPTA